MKKTTIITMIVTMVIIISGSCSKNEENSEKDIISFRFEEFTPVVDGTITGNEITATIPESGDFTKLTPTIVVSANATVTPASGELQDFTNYVIYKVTAEDGSVKSYTVRVKQLGEKDFYTINWEDIAQPALARAWMAIACVDNKIYIMGGTINTNTEVTSTIEVYDPATNVWDATKSDMPYELNGSTACVVEGKIYVMGGMPNPFGPATNAVLVYDPLTDVWDVLASMPVVRVAHAACALNGKIYVIGGELEEPPHGTMLNRLDIFDPETNTWSSGQQMPEAVTWLTASAVNDKIYACGGATDVGGSGIASIFEYDPQLDTWTEKNGLLTARWCLTSCTLNDVLFTLGGAPTGFSPGLVTVEVYSPVTNRTYQATGFNYRCFGQGTVVCQNSIYNIGGCNAPPPTYAGINTKAEKGTPVFK